MRKSFTGVTAIALMLLVGQTRAATYTAVANGDWQTGTTWDLGVAPATASGDTFNLNGFTVTFTNAKGDFGDTWTGSGVLATAGSNIYTTTGASLDANWTGLISTGGRTVGSSGTFAAGFWQASNLRVYMGGSAGVGTSASTQSFGGQYFGTGQLCTLNNATPYGSTAVINPGTYTQVGDQLTLASAGTMKLASQWGTLNLKGATIDIPLFDNNTASGIANTYVGTTGNFSKVIFVNGFTSTILIDLTRVVTDQSFSNVVIVTDGGTTPLVGWGTNSAVKYQVGATVYTDPTAVPNWSGLSVTQSGSNLVLNGTFAAIPEPASLSLLAFSSLGLLARRRQH